MGEDPKYSCLTATTAIVVACVGALATIIAALIVHYHSDSPAPGPAPASSVAPAPTPAPASRFQNDTRQPANAPQPSADAAQLEGVYDLQFQNLYPPMQAMMTITEEEEGIYRWQWDYKYFANPYIPFQSTGQLTEEGGQWQMSLDNSTEPGAQAGAYSVDIKLSRSLLTIEDHSGHKMTWRRR